MDWDNQIRKCYQAMMQAALMLIIALISFSIYGAFLGSAKAQFFFTSPAFSIFWIALCLLLIAALLFVPKRFSTFGLLFIHLGCILVLAGAMYGSQTGHKLQKLFFGADKICRGQMAIEQEHESSYVLSSSDRQIAHLPFSIRLNEFRIDYYQPASPHTGPAAIRDFISDVTVIRNGRPVASKNIEVNHPLHYGGYYFYQQSYDIQNGQYSILQVVSDSGLSIVYSGYLMLGAGVFWHFWFRHLLRRSKDGN